ncbi:sodium:proton antiporter [Sorangium cellulosum]|uniref:Cation:proton antiporter n=2 Tax=Sorangium cellulosum TaxID=56 RepID=S4XIN4_SORCE|nr:NADH-quinone oxidoreductase subunit K [Sorangium cellulosum]AGP32404.1 cation:proton antiporter [Sorangium cellulosum So0157-2]
MIGAAAIAAGALLAAGLYLMLSRDVQLVAIGFFLLSNGVNLFVLTSAGMPAGAAPPLIPADDPAAALARPTADPLAQAFILTAIVIGFGMAAFLLGMAVDIHRRKGKREPSGRDDA